MSADAFGRPADEFAALVPAAAGSEDSTTLTNIVGPQFEHEARLVVADNFDRVCVWGREHTRIVSRIWDGGSGSREEDITCFVSNDDGSPCVDLLESGVYVLRSSDYVVAPEVAHSIVRSQNLSPDRRAPENAKYFLAGAYSGDLARGLRKAKIGPKVTQMATLLDFLMARKQESMGVRPKDITAIVGAAGLAFSYSSGSRQEVKDRLLPMIREFASSDPNLSRLMAARRLLVYILDTSQSPQTFLLRAMTRLTDSVAQIGKFGVVLCLVVRVGIHAVNGQVHGLRHLSALPGKLLSRMWQHVSRCATFPAAELASLLLLPTRRGVASATGGTLCRFALLFVLFCGQIFRRALFCAAFCSAHQAFN